MLKKLEHFEGLSLHFLGSCGTLMAGLCQLAEQAGLHITGSDRSFSPPMSDLISPSCKKSFDDNSYLQADILVVGNTMRYDDPLILKARQKNILLLSCMDFLEYFTQQKKVIAICGTHGKSTTTSLVIHLLKEAKINLSYLVGALPKNGTSNAFFSKESEYFILEADEYDISYFDKRSKMQTLWPHILLVNALEFDHADIFTDRQTYLKAFEYLFRRVSNSGALFTLDHLPEPLRQMRESFEQRANSTFIDQLLQAKKQFKKFFLKNQKLYHQDYGLLHQRSFLFGPNLDNLDLVFKLGLFLQLEESFICHTLKTFKGVCRRFEVYESSSQTKILFDFAHHPTAVQLALEILAKFTELSYEQKNDLIKKRQSQGKEVYSHVLVEKASNSMSSGIFNDQLLSLPQHFPSLKITFVEKNEFCQKDLLNFIKSCLKNKETGMILSNNPSRWTDFQCVSSMLNLVESPVLSMPPVLAS